MKIAGCFVRFCGIPRNYAKVNDFLSRSAQPEKDDFLWLKNQGVTDIVNFRTMKLAGISFDEKEIVENLGMKYHSIPSITRFPIDENVFLFLNLMNNISNTLKKIHVHCRAGADRTGMYVFIYKMLNNFGSLEENKAEWMKFGHHAKLYPDLIPWAENFVNRFK